MISFYKTDEKNRLAQVDAIEPGCWVNLVAPTEQELMRVQTALNVEPDFLRAALDEEETSRIEQEEEQTLIIIDIPVAEDEAEPTSGIYATMPVGIIVTEHNVITVALRDTPIISDFAEGRLRNILTGQKTKFVLQVLLHVAKKYLFCLRQIDRLSHAVERRLHEAMKNNDLFRLLDMEKTLIYFTTSLQSDSLTIKKITSGRFLKLYEEDQDLLEDVIIEINQAIEMSNIYSNVLSGTMDAFSSVMSNNLNMVMRVLTVITILLTIPNVIFGFYGMNVAGLPVPYMWFPAALAGVATVICAVVLKKKDLF